MANDESVRKVFRCLKTSQAKLDDDANYVAAIARETDLTRKTVHNVVEHLLDLGLVEVEREGRRKLISVDSSLVDTASAS